MAPMPDVLHAGPLTLVRWRPGDVDEVLEAVRSSFADLRRWMHGAQTVPTREEQREALAACTHLADVDRVEIHVDCANEASARVAGELGYRLLRTEPRERLALGHTGAGHVWEARRDGWAPPHCA